MGKTIDLRPRDKMILSPKEYVAISAKDRRNIRSTHFVPPEIGANNFGYFVVKLKSPIYSKN